ncbi:MAG TPA: amidohydrolase family protein [Xanthobacteraceae bacterium]|nr:amidohydrolase family protein [Xanthobacteraceae bacterium]
MVETRERAEQTRQSAGPAERSAGGDSIFGHPAIDCDLHPAVPNTQALMPYFDDYWREQFVNRGVDRLNFAMSSSPPNAPFSARPDWRPKAGVPGSDFEMLKAQALDGFGVKYAIANVIHGAQAMHSEDMAAVFCRAVNDWLAKEWLDRDARLRGSILVPTENAELAVEEIERRAGDRRFVQVLLPAMGEKPLGRRAHWPIYRAAEKHGLPIAVHAGSTYRHAPTSTGWPSYFLEDYVNQSGAFESQLLSLISEGVFAKFPDIRFVFSESGFCWVPAFMWRAGKTWRGVRAEVPWVKTAPANLIREHVRFTLQPVDAPPDSDILEQIVEQLGSDDMLMFSTDYPHWHFEGTDALPRALAGDLARKVLHDNAMATYTRLHD